MTKVIKARYIQIGRIAEVDYQKEAFYRVKPEKRGTAGTSNSNVDPRSEPECEPPAGSAEAEKLIAEAQAQAEKILLDAEGQAEALREEARAKGFEEGQKGALECAHLEIGEAVSELSALLHSLEEQKTGMLKNYEGKIRDLAIHIAKKVIQTELDNNSEMFLNIYKNAVQELRDQEWIRLSVSDLQVQFATENADTLMSLVKGAKHIEIVGLPEAPSGTCIVETPDGIVDASLDTQMDKIKEAFSDVEMFLESTPEEDGPFAD